MLYTKPLFSHEPDLVGVFARLEPDFCKSINPETTKIVLYVNNGYFTRTESKD
jgi:hypothetical protein